MATKKDVNVFVVFKETKHRKMTMQWFFVVFTFSYIKYRGSIVIMQKFKIEISKKINFAFLHNYMQPARHTQYYREHFLTAVIIFHQL